MIRPLRRSRQALPPDECIAILETGKECVLAVAGDDGYPYAVPVNYVYYDGAIFFHSAPQGHKIDALKREPRCSICVIDKDDVVAEEFTTYFRSVMVFGKADFVDDTETKIEILRQLSKKYSPGIDPTAEIAKFLSHVCIVRIIPEHISGKEAIELTKLRGS
ncbi:MAG: pyridoxamine 5'-phosphate oxidase family protein [Duncaniella sp.]|nr:pyridoxamine 5'-phosphate oxidase family protein [Duncaniella sp.]